VIPALTISSANASVINSPPAIINSLVSGWKISFDHGPGIESCVGGGLRYLALQGRDRCL